MTHIDHQLNRFIETLDDYGLGENTFICFTSDHGEMMGDHHLFRKGYAYEGSAGIPMILAAPKGSSLIPRGVCGQPVELRDVMPTLLECAGLEIPVEVEGQSFLPLARGEQVHWRPYLHGEHTIFGQSMQLVTDGRQKYVWFSGDGHEQLLDLENDPQERHDLARDPAWQGRLSVWRERLIQELIGREEGFTDGQCLIAGRPVQPCLAQLRAQSRRGEP